MSKIEVKLNPDVPPTGSDLGFVNAARRSFNTRSEWDTYLTEKNTVQYKLKDKDRRLLEFLARGMTADDFDEFVSDLGHEVYEWEMVLGSVEDHPLKEKLWEFRNTPTHDTPFNHGFISFEVKAPIFVRSQLVKHEYLILSEFSRRYKTDNIEFYEPDYWRKAAENKKQGSLEEAVESETLLYDYKYYGEEKPLELYYKMVQEGVAPEQARMVLPQSTMTEWTWSGTPGAFFKMCQLRLHPEAQYESRQVAQQVYDYLVKYYPVSTPLMVKGVL